MRHLWVPSQLACCKGTWNFCKGEWETKANSQDATVGRRLESERTCKEPKEPMLVLTPEPY